MAECAWLPRDSSVLIATHNSGKFAEMRGLLAALGCSVLAPDAFGLDAPDETADSFEGNALIKAIHASQQTGMIALADDSGLCVPVLDNRPGLESARWARESGGWGRAHARLYTELKETGLWADGPEAVMNCALAIAHPTGQAKTFLGRVTGRLTWPPRADGPGFDPIFVPDGYAQSFAEMETDAKARMDARAQAFTLLCATP